LIVRTGRRASDLTVRSITTGAPAGRLAFRARPAFACLNPDRIVVGEQRLSIARLPSLKAEWSQPVAGASTIDSIAVTRSFIAYTTDGSLNVWVVPLPPPARL